MKNKIVSLSALSVCISLALNAQAKVIPAAVDTNVPAEASCPADLNVLSPEQLAALPKSCLNNATDMQQWIAENSTVLTAAGATALAATVAIAAGGGGGSSSGSNDGGNTPAPGEGGGGEEEKEEEEKEEEKEDPKKDPISDYDGYEQGNVIIGDGQQNDLGDNVSVGAGQVGNLIGGDGTSNLIGGDQEVVDGGKGTVVVGDDTSTVIGGETIVGGDGSVGTEIVGDNADVVKDGNTEVGDGGSGTVVIGDGAHVGNGGDTIVGGEGSAGTIVEGDKGEVVNDGKIEVGDGGTGTIVRGDEGTVENKGETIVGGEGSAGTIVEGNKGEVINDGGTEVSDGGTGTIVRGDEGTVENKGETIVGGEGSAGTIVEGNNGEVINDGNTEVSEGGTGTIVRGDEGTVENKGETIVGGEGSAGTIVEGNNGEVINDGNTEVSEGGTGTIVRGDNGSVENKGDTIVGGAGSTGVIIEGDNGSVSQKGNLVVEDGATGVSLRGDNGSVSLEGNANISAGATGVKVEGNNADVRNTGNINVLGAGSIGLDITSHDAKLSNVGNIYVSDKGIGVVLAGDRFNTILDGNLTVDAGDKRVSANGVRVSGNNGLLNITGNVEVKDLQRTVGGVRSDLTGVSVEGNGNHVNIDGAITLNYEAKVASRPSSNSIKEGLSVRGENNNININGGANFNYKIEVSSDRNNNVHGAFHVISVDGYSNSLNIGGNSSFVINGNAGDRGSFAEAVARSASYLKLSGKNNSVVLAEDFDFNFTHINGKSGYDGTSGSINIFTLDGDGNSLENKGIIEVGRGGTFAINAKNGSHIINKGQIGFSHLTNADKQQSTLIYVIGGASFKNDKGGILTVVSTEGGGYVNKYNDSKGSYLPYIVSISGVASSNAQVENDGEIKVSGQAAFGIIGGNNSIITNRGLISINSMSNSVGASGELNRETGLWGEATNYIRGAGLLANSATAKLWNTGEIRVHNAGMGMVANNGTIWNQGEITLTSDNPSSDALYAMAALGNGVAINDTNGVININTDKGIAFYKTDNGKIVNFGIVNFNGNVIDKDDANFGAADYDGDTNKDTQIAAAGETKAITSAKPEAVFYLADNVANYGTTTANTNVTFKGTLHNTGSLTSSAAVATAAMVNEGTLTADTVTTSGTMYNTSAVTSAGLMRANYLTNKGTVTSTGLNVTTTLYNDAAGVFNNTGALTAKYITNLNNIETDTLSVTHTLHNAENATLTSSGVATVVNQHNLGTFNAAELNTTGTTVNSGTMNIAGEAKLSTAKNTGTMNVGRLVAQDSARTFVNEGSVTGSIDGVPVLKRFSLWNAKGATITNSGQAIVGSGGAGIANTLWQHQSTLANASLVNYGDMIAKNGFSAITTDMAKSGSTPWIHNMDTGRIVGDSPLLPLVRLGALYNFYNAGEVTVTGDNAVAISTLDGGTTVNRVLNEGTINVGTLDGKTSGTNGTGLTGIRAGNNAAIINNAKDGVINVYADNSYAFARTASAATAQIINNGEVNLLCDTGCGIIASGSVATGDDLTYTAPGDAPAVTNPVKPNPAGKPGVPTVPGTGNTVSNGLMTVAGYTVGTNHDGSAGKLSARNLSFGEGVTVDTGFTSGTAARSITLNDVFRAQSYSGEENIKSESVVWNASTQKNDAGNLDIVMDKNDYAAVTSDASQNSLANALDKAYTNNSLFNSLNVGSTKALDNALKQISGARANALDSEARIIGQRFTMLADSAPQVTSSGLSFNVVAKGDKRAEMDNKVTYDMVALAQKFDSGFGDIIASYGIARLAGNGGNDSTRAGNNGLTGGYSQFFGLGHSLPFGENNSWVNSVRMDMHQLDSRRNINFEGINRSASASAKQQQLQLRSEGVKKFEMENGLTMSPFAGLKMRHNMTGSYQETGAGDFNLSQNRYSETAVDAVTGLRLNYAGKNGWAAHATLEAGPNLSFSQSARKASLQGMNGQQFNVNDGKKAGGINGQAVMGVSYQSDKASFGMNAYQWQEDGAADKGLMFNVTRHF